MNVEHGPGVQGVLDVPGRWALGSAMVLAWMVAASAGAQSLRGNPVDAVPELRQPAVPQPSGSVAPGSQRPGATETAAVLAQRLVPRSFVVEGVTAVPFDEVVALLEPLAGKETTVAGLAGEVNAITQLYQQRGFALSYALLQNQNFNDGIVKVTVVEGYVAQVVFTGDVGPVQERLDRLAKKLTEERPLRRETLDGVLNLMRTTPGISIVPRLDWPRRADGATAMVIEASREGITATATLSDMGTGNQPLVGATLNSSTALGEKISVAASVPLEHEDVRYVRGAIELPLNDAGLSWEGEGYHYEARPLEEGALTFQRRIKNQRLATGLRYDAAGPSGHFWQWRAGMQAMDSNERWQLRDILPGQLAIDQRTRSRAAYAEMTYSGNGPWRSQHRFTLGLTKGWKGMGARTDYSFSPLLAALLGPAATQNMYREVAAQAAELDYLNIKLNASETLPLAPRTQLRLGALLQYSSQRLPTTEQVSFGKWRYGMGYEQGAIGGDKGLGLEAELSHRLQTGWSGLSDVIPYIGVDYAAAWYNGLRGELIGRQAIASAWVGVRVTDQRRYLLNFNLARPLRDVNPTVAEDSWRFNASYSLFYRGW